MPEFCSCGSELPPDALFCHKCGKPQRELQEVAVEAPAVGQGDGHCKWREDVIVPVICPTCQNVFARQAKTSIAGVVRLLYMGLFPIF